MSALIDSQKGSQRSATAARKEQKKTYKNIGKPIAITVGALVLIFSLPSLLHEWRAKQQDALSKPTASSAVQVPAVKTVTQVTRQRITLTTEWSKGVRVFGDQCINWWGENPTGYEVQASGGPIPAWIDWAEWKSARAARKLGDPWQFRFKAKEGTLDLEYEIRGRDQCIKK